MTRTRQGRTIGGLVAALLCAAVLAPNVGAQDEPPESSTTSSSTVPADTSTTSTTTAPGSSSTTTTTTTIYTPTIPPGLEQDPRLPFLVDPGDEGVDIPLAQNPFDPRTVTVLPERVAAATAVLEAAQRSLATLQRDLDRRSSEVGALAEQVERLDGEVRRSVEAAAEARKALRDHAVRAYMVGPVDQRLALLNSSDAVDMGVARSYLDVVASTRERLLRDYEELSDGLRREHAELARTLGEGRSELGMIAAELPAAFDAVLAASEELAAYEAGAHAYIERFVFPVAGDVEFIDSWGYPRMTGTASAHWHQGTDIFAQAGTPLIASENGVLDRVGTASLGGTKLWVAGDSGNHYYYAHLSAFAEGIHEGQRVRAGEVIGYVGDTGNAKGTSPHLHFEIHPNGDGPVNPYPLLKAAYGARPVIRAVAPTTTAPPTTAPATPLAATAPTDRPGG